MSFMYNPAPYDDQSALNHLQNKNIDKVWTSWDSVKEKLMNILVNNEKTMIAIDGYIGADFDLLENTLQDKAIIIKTNDFMKTEKEINEMLASYLPIDPIKDPACIFGKLYQGDLMDFFNKDKIREFHQRYSDTEKSVVLIGYGSSLSCFREEKQFNIYIDLTPKDAVLRSQNGFYRNLGVQKKQAFSDMIRRYYFVDVEVLMKQRKYLIQEKQIDYYVLQTWKNEWQMMDKVAMYDIFDALSKQPFRGKPVYLEGIWGGEYMRKIRNIPKNIAPRIAWVFDFIPLEASVLVDINGTYLDIPFYSFLNANENSILGESIAKRFAGNFPIRFNYDDTWHSDGNMSIQVHPGKAFAKENYNEDHSQDEAYYVIATGHDAKTYCGFKENGVGFIDKCRDVMNKKEILDYDKYVNSVSSNVGLQIMIPSGTVHASGRNQVVLELGSYTVGAYTFKMYDYNRQDLDGNLRPIHLCNAENVLDVTRNREWVREVSNIKPILIEENDKWSEYIIGKNPYMYYETHRVHIDTNAIYEGNNDEQFTVLTLVDGEEAIIYDKEHTEYCYHAKYLDVIVLPATIDTYIVEAKGYQPVTLHKTIIKKGGETNE